MKNLKKVLSLVLALAMALSLMTAAFAADASDYKDYSKVTYKEAVDVMTAAGIFNGGDGNNFNPDATLNREQAAKIITYMLMGQKEADKLTTTIAPYADVAATRWSAGSIAYCTNEGIIAGDGNGRFNPTASVTGLQFGKMLLVALGYDAKIEKLVGNSWAINAATLAINAGLDEDMDISLSKELTREEAAQMAYNAMQADVVDYENRGTEITLPGGGTVVIDASKASAVTTRKDWGTNIISEKSAPYTVQFAEQYCRDLTLTGNKGADDFGRPAHTWKYDKNTIGTYADEAVLIYTTEVKANEIADDADDAGYDVLTSGTETSLTIYDNGTPDQVMTGNDVKNVIDAKQKIGGNGVVIEVYDADDDDTVDTMLMIYTYAAKVIDITEDDEDTKADERELEVEICNDRGATIKLDEDVAGFDAVYDAVEEDDIVLVTPEGNHGITNRNDIIARSVELPETVSGAVTAYTSNKTVTIGGEKYEYAAKTAIESGYKYVIKDEYNLYLDSNGYVVYVDGVAADDNYVYVAAVDNDGKFGETDYVANAFFPDGTQKVIDVKEKLADDTTSVNASTKGWFTYTVKNDEYTLKAVEAGKTITGNVAANAQITKNGSVAINAQSYVKGTNSTVFVVVDEDDNVKSYTGIKNVPSIKAGDAVNKIVVAVVKNTDGYAEYVYIDTADQATIKGATSSASDLVYILNPAEVETSVDEDDNTFYTYDAIVNGKETTINTNNNTDFANAGLYTDVSYDADGYVDDASRVTDGDDFAVVGGFNDIVTYKDGVLTLARNSSYALADNYSIYVIDAQKEVKTMTANKLANTYEDVALNADIEVVLQDDLATALYITLK